MGDEGIFATTAEVSRKVGANASATANTEAYINDFITQAESEINAECRYNFSDNYGALNVDVKALLKRAASNKAAIDVINFDLEDMPLQSEARTRINVLLEGYKSAIRLLKEMKVQTFINGA